MTRSRTGRENVHPYKKNANCPTLYPRSDAGSPMVVNEIEMDQGHGYEELIAEMEGDVDEGHSGSGSIISVAGQINGIPAGYPNDVITTHTEMVHDGEDGNIWPVGGDGTGQRLEPPPKQSCTNRGEVLLKLELVKTTFRRGAINIQSLNLSWRKKTGGQLHIRGRGTASQQSTSRPDGRSASSGGTKC